MKLKNRCKQINRLGELGLNKNDFKNEDDRICQEYDMDIFLTDLNMSLSDIKPIKKN